MRQVFFECFFKHLSKAKTYSYQTQLLIKKDHNKVVEGYTKNKNGAKRSLLRFGARDRDRTGTGITTHGILSPGRLPVPPLEQNIT